MRQRQTGRLRLQPLRRCWIFSANRKPRKPQEQHSHLSLSLILSRCTLRPDSTTVLTLPNLYSKLKSPLTLSPAAANPTQ